MTRLGSSGLVSNFSATAMAWCFSGCPFEKTARRNWSSPEPRSEPNQLLLFGSARAGLGYVKNDFAPEGSLWIYPSSPYGSLKWVCIFQKAVDQTSILFLFFFGKAKAAENSPYAQLPLKERNPPRPHGFLQRPSQVGKLLGKWPLWPETLREARRRFANRRLGFRCQRPRRAPNFVFWAERVEREPGVWFFEGWCWVWFGLEGNERETTDFESCQHFEILLLGIRMNPSRESSVLTCLLIKMNWSFWYSDPWLCRGQSVFPIRMPQQGKSCMLKNWSWFCPHYLEYIHIYIC